MSINEQHIRLAARMYEMRDAAKHIAGDSYGERIKGWKDCLSAIAKGLDVGPLEAVPMICKANPVSGVEIMWLTAAAVELSEPEATA